MISKLDVFEHILADGNVRVEFDSRRQGVHVPIHLRYKEHVVLEFGFELEKPVRCLSIGHGAVSGIIDFGGFACHCVIPWDAIFSVRNVKGYGRVWIESMPERLRSRAMETIGKQPIRVIQGGGQCNRIVERQLRLVSPGC